MTPLLFFFEVSLADWMKVLGWSTTIFWTVDMFLHFNTATYIRGVLVTSFREIAKRYLKTMFLLDFAIVFAEWLAFFLERSTSDAKSLENVYLFRLLKGLRFAKVIRIFKFERILQEFSARINSTVVLLCLRPLLHVFFLLVFNHTLACVWYGIGTASGGWTTYLHDDCLGYKYATSLHWAVSQLHGNADIFPENLPERVFTCSNAILALILYSAFLSSITNGMMQIHALRAEHNGRQTKIRAVLARRKISTDLTMRIKKHLEYISKSTKTDQTDLEAEAIILQSLPKDLVQDLYAESRTPVPLGHSYFAMLNVRRPRIMRQLSNDAMTETSHVPDQIVFHVGDACNGMSFVTNGVFLYERKQRQSTARCSDFLHVTPTDKTEISVELDYEKIALTGSDLLGNNINRDPLMFLKHGFWLSEAALWMSWEYCGNLRAKTPAMLLIVDASHFANVVKQFHVAYVNSARYAKQFIERMVKEGVHTDIVPDDALEDDFEGLGY